MSHYNRKALAEALAGVGVAPGGLVFSHGNIGLFGYPEEGRDARAMRHTVHGAFRDALGPDGILAVPCFSYSACKGEPFDPATTPGVGGMFPEWLRKRPDAVRSLDPIFSVAAVGPGAGELLADLSSECFGPGSFWERLAARDGIVVNLNLNAGFNALAHYAERLAGAPWRMDKAFPALVYDPSSKTNPVSTTVRYYCQRPDAAYADYDLLSRLLENAGLVARAKVGRGGIVAVKALAFLDFFLVAFRENPAFLHPAASNPAPNRAANPAANPDPDSGGEKEGRNG